jgi:hypothetical protein
LIVDANLLIYAVNAQDSRHGRARDWLAETLNGPTRCGLPWISLSAFLRIATNPRAFDAALAMEEAWTQVEEWLAAPAAWVPTPTTRHAEVLGRLLSAHRLDWQMVTDARIAALAIEHGVPIASSDGDFARFTEIRWIDPLADPP